MQFICSNKLKMFF